MPLLLRTLLWLPVIPGTKPKACLHVWPCITHPQWPHRKMGFFVVPETQGTHSHPRAFALAVSIALNTCIILHIIQVWVQRPSQKILQRAPNISSPTFTITLLHLLLLWHYQHLKRSRFFFNLFFSYLFSLGYKMHMIRDLSLSLE